MADVKIPVSANVKGVTDELDQVRKKIAEVEKAAERLGRIKFQPIDSKAIAAELKRLEQMMLETHRRVAQGTTPAAPAPQPAAGGGGAMAPRSPVASGGGGRRGGFGAYTHAPGFHTIGQNLISGVGGGFSTVANYGTRGAIAGAYGGGGLVGGAMGLARGLGIGALALGAYKVGQGVSEGYDLAKERAGTLDALKRQLGDVGVSFERLKAISEGAADGLQINSKEAAELAKEFNRLSRGHGGVGGLMDATRVSVGVSRAYGLDPSAGVGFFGGMANMDRRQNNRELALLLAETINRSGMSARADEVMQAIQGYAASVSRMVMGTGGLREYSGAYSSLMGMHGMTSDTASSILSAANASVMRMGGAGEAGQNFTLTALSRHGALNPVQAMALAEGGLFGTRSGVFGRDSAISRFIGQGGMPGGEQGVTNFSALRQGIRGLGGDKWLQLDAAKRYFGVGSLSQAAALMNLDEGGAGALQGALEKAGIDINKVNASGIQALAKLGPNASREDLLKAASSNREETEWTKMQDSLKKLDDIKINTGDKLIGPINSMREYLAAIAEKLAPDSAYVKSQKNLQSGISFDKQISDFDAQTEELRKKAPAGYPMDRFELSRSMERERMVAKFQHDLTGVDPGILKQLSDTDRMLGMPAGTSARQIAKESGFNPAAVSPAGALGMAQVMPQTLSALEKRMGRKLDPMDPQDAVLIHREVMRENMAHFGNVSDALKAYNGGWDKSKWGNAETSSYTDGILNTPLPAGHSQAGAGRGFINPDPVSVDVMINPRHAADMQPAGPPVRTRVSVPRGSGVQ